MLVTIGIILLPMIIAVALATVGLNLFGELESESISVESTE